MAQEDETGMAQEDGAGIIVQEDRVAIMAQKDGPGIMVQEDGAGIMAQSVKCCFRKYEDLSSISTAHVKELNVVDQQLPCHSRWESLAQDMSWANWSTSLAYLPHLRSMRDFVSKNRWMVPKM